MKTPFAASFVGVLFIAIIGISCEKDETTPDTLQVLGLTEKAGNYGYKELDEATVRWYFGSPADNTNPLLDETGALSVAAKQPLSGITILPSNFGGKTTRTLTIPSSNYVYVSPLGTVVWYYENDPCDPTFKPAAGQSLKDFLYEASLNFNDLSKANASVKLDGVELMTDKTKFRWKSDVYEATIHKDFDNPKCDYTGKKAKLVSDSYSILLKIPKGKHTLIMKGTIPTANPADVFEPEVTWNLTVE